MCEVYCSSVCKILTKYLIRKNENLKQAQILVSVIVVRDQAIFITGWGRRKTWRGRDFLEENLWCGKEIFHCHLAGPGLFSYSQTHKNLYTLWSSLV